MTHFLLNLCVKLFDLKFALNLSNKPRSKCLTIVTSDQTVVERTRCVSPSKNTGSGIWIERTKSRRSSDSGMI